MNAEPELDNAMLRGDWWEDGKEPYDDWYDRCDRETDRYYEEKDRETDHPKTEGC